MSSKKNISRRQFLRVSALTAAGIAGAACVPATPAPVEEPSPVPVEAPPEPVEVPAKYTEAPSLAALVAEGKLPPVEERLPLEPFVVGPGVRIHEQDLDWEVGEYSREGEVLRSITPNPTWSFPCQYACEHFLNTPPHYIAPITGNLCSSWSVNEDCTQYEFTLRKGLKWSDGVPVTTEDIRFGYEDVLLNVELTPVFPADLRARAEPDGEPMKVEIVDDFTFRVSFTEPNGTKFLYRMGMGNLWAAYTFLLKPSHYLKQFHKDYADPDELAAKIQAAGLSEGEWHRLFLEEGGGWGGMDCAHMAEEGRLPVLRGWIVKPSPPDLIIMERNPYYWKVDIEGQQLPYIERIDSVVVASVDSIPMKIVAGEVNYQIGYYLNHTDISLYKEYEEEHGYRISLDMVYHNAPVALFFNFNHPDETWRQIVWQKEFRHAINAAIDYREIIDALYLGLGKVNPWIPDVTDKDLANQLLDQVGLDQRDADGWRLAPDGKRFEFRMDIRIDWNIFIKSAEVIQAHLEEVGIYTPLKMVEGGLWGQIRDANELYASIDWCDDCNWPYLVTDYMPTARIRWGQLWHRWIETEGKEGEEPPEWMKELYDLYSEMMSIDPRTARAEAAEKRFAEWFMEYVPLLPLARDVANPYIVPANAGNIPHSGRDSALGFATEQVFFRH